MNRVIFFTDYYLPGFRAGGPIKSISTLVESLESVRDVYIFTRDHDFLSPKEPYDSIERNKIISRNNHKIFYSSSISMLEVYRFLKEVHPDYIYLNSFFSNLSIITLITSKLFFPKIRMVLAPRGEFSPGALGIKYLKKIFYIRLVKLMNLYDDIQFHATDLSEKNYILEYLPKTKVRVAANFIRKYHGKYQTPVKNIGELKIIFLSRISRKKNLSFAINIINQIDLKQNVEFDIYGVAEDKQYLTDCMNKFNSTRISYKGEINPNQVPEVMSKYHVFFLPTLGENFGHVIVEAMSLGLIPLLSDKTPWNDINQYKAGWALPLDSNECFIDKVSYMISLNNDDYLRHSSNVYNYFEDKFDQSSLLSEYENLF